MTQSTKVNVVTFLFRLIMPIYAIFKKTISLIPELF